MTDFTPCPRTVELCAKVAETAPYKRLGMICACSETLADWTAQAIRALIKETSDAT